MPKHGDLRDYVGKQPPHMCMDDHEPIGCWSDDELCPVCKANNARDAAQEEVEELRLALSNASKYEEVLKAENLAHCETIQELSASLAEGSIAQRECDAIRQILGAEVSSAPLPEIVRDHFAYAGFADMSALPFPLSTVVSVPDRDPWECTFDAPCVEAAHHPAVATRRWIAPGGVSNQWVQWTCPACGRRFTEEEAT